MKAIDRREVLKRTALASAAVAAPTIIPASALGRDGAVAPSERIVMGGIGIGGRGGYDLGVLLQEPEVQFVAVCDVKRIKREAVKQRVNETYKNHDCATYRDMREFLSQRRDLDAVLIATGDRWHTTASILAMQAGLDVFCEKPCTMSIAQGQALVATARRYGRIFQSGMQRLSEANFVFADQLARTGRLGKVHTVYAHLLPFQMRTDWLPAEPEPHPEELDWNLWLGPAPWRPYNPRYTAGCGAWLNYYDFGTGVAGWGSHTICQCQSGVDLLGTSPVEYAYPGRDDFSSFTCRFANGVNLVLNPEGWPKPGTRGMWHGSCGVRYEGSEGWVSIADGYQRPEVSSPSLLRESDKLVRDHQQQTGRPLHHIRDFLQGVRTRRPCIANEEVMHRTMTTNHLVNICLLLQRNLKWDPASQCFPGDAEANRLLTRATREPWQV